MYQESQTLLPSLSSYDFAALALPDLTPSSSAIRCIRFKSFDHEALGSPVGIRPIFSQLRHSDAWRSAVYYSIPNTTDGRFLSTVEFLSSIAFQILDLDPSRFYKVRELCNAMRTANNWTEPTLLVLVSMLLGAREEPRPLHLFIEGLDNCDTKTRQTLLDYLLPLFVNDTMTVNILHITFSVKEMDADIKQSFSRYGSRVAHEDHHFAPTDTVLRGWTSQIITENHYPLSAKRRLLRALKTCQTSTDLVFALHALQNLGTPSDPKTLHSTEILTRNLPPPLEQCIEEKFSSLGDWSRNALGWMLSAKRPLNIAELCTAVALSSGDPGISERHLPLEPKLLVTQSFAPLIYFTGEGAVMVRPGIIREALTQLADSERLQRTESQVAEGEHKSQPSASIPDDLQITEILLAYLCKDDLVGPVRRALGASDLFIQPTGWLFQLIHYAVEFWPLHYLSAESQHEGNLRALERAKALIQDNRFARAWPTLNDKINRKFSPPDICILDTLSLCAQLGLTSAVKELQKSAGLLARQAAMCAASWGGHDHVVEIFLQGAQAQGAQPWDVSKALEYASACGHDEIVGRLLKYSKAAQRKPDSLDFLLCQAARFGFVQQISLFCKAGGDVNAAPEGMTPLQCAAECGHYSVVDHLIKETKADIDGRGTRRETALMLASAKGHGMVVEILLGTDFYARTELSPGEDSILDPLGLAAKAGQLTTVELLLKHIQKCAGGNVAMVPSLLTDALLAAVDQGHVKVVERLLIDGADAAVTDTTGHTPLYRALAQDHGGLAGKIIDYIKSPSDLEDIGEIFLRSCADGHYKILLWCLTKKPDLRSHRGQRGETGLHVASKAGYVEIVQDLLAHGSDVHTLDDEGWPPLAHAAVAGKVEVVKLLLQQGARVNKTTAAGCDILLAIAECDETPHVQEITRLLLEKGADPNGRDMWDWTPLLRASSKCNLNMIKALMEYQGPGDKVEPNAKGRWGWNALHIIADAECGADKYETATAIAEFLIVGGTNPLERDSDGWIPLHLAARQGNLPLLQFLRLKHPSSLAATAVDGRTVLDFAYSRPSVIKWIDSEQPLGGSINRVDREGETPLMKVARAGNAESTRLFLEMRADPWITNRNGMTALFMAAYYGHCEAAEVLLEKHPKLLSIRNDQDQTALHYAIISREAAFAFMLLDKYYASNDDSARQDLCLTDKEGNTPLISAVHQRYYHSYSYQVAEKLLELGAELDTRNTEGDTALTLAVAKKDERMVKILLNSASEDGKLSYNLDAGAGKHRTALYEAARCSNTAIVEQLLEAGATLNQVGGEHGTALCIACRLERDDMVDFLLEKKADIALPGETGEYANALSCAVYSESLDLVEKLIKAGAGEAEINAQDTHGRSSVHMAARWCTWEMIALLKKHGGDLTKIDKQKRTVLHHAAMSGYAPLVSAILDIEALQSQVHAQDVDGWTPLHWACRAYDGNAVVEVLVDEYGANIGTVATYGWSPYNLAVFHDETSTADFLEQRKAKAEEAAVANVDGMTLDSGVVPAPRERKWKAASNGPSGSCDSCFCSIRGVRWHCEACKDFDLCFKCYWTVEQTHHREHVPFKRITTTGDDPDKEPPYEDDVAVEETGISVDSPEQRADEKDDAGQESSD
ncbi:ankyrin repeat-containing domain protein [Podospora australis]|uniref:Ankyrin repeat-containing domain protein n=1 Tax=Podospora australis TaxID=1536484 RepID=A0AAN7AHF8_9PEZI|nr:ankyrin repeat-containing domain protein [Podospora australis]